MATFRQLFNSYEARWPPTSGEVLFKLKGKFMWAAQSAPSRFQASHRQAFHPQK